MLSSASDKTKLLAKNVSKNSDLEEVEIEFPVIASTFACCTVNCACS